MLFDNKKLKTARNKFILTFTIEFLQVIEIFKTLLGNLKMIRQNELKIKLVESKSMYGDHSNSKNPVLIYKIMTSGVKYK